MANRPRIAFCFSGQARTLDQTYLFFQKSLFDAAKQEGFDYDVFCAVEDDEDVGKVQLLNPTKVEKIKSSEVEKIIEEKYGDFIKTSFKTKYKRAYYTYKGIVAYLQQLYKVGRSIKIRDNKNYDIIVRLRFDIVFFNKFNFKQILKDLNGGNTIICNNFDMRIIGIGGFLGRISYSTRQIEDFFFFGDEKSMNVLGNIFDNFNECFLGHEVKKIFKPIYFLSNQLVKFILYINNKFPFCIKSLPIEFGAYTIFVPEKSYYEYFLFHNIKIIKEEISILIMRKNIETSLVKLSQKSKYEL